LRAEMAYLRTQKSDSHATDGDEALHERETVLSSVRYPTVAIDAVAVVIGSEGR
jgi:hypothetical protein